MAAGSMPRGIDPAHSEPPAGLSVATADGLLLTSPSSVLTHCVAGYWYEPNNHDHQHRQPPDGCVDIVIHRDHAGTHADIWGTSTTATLTDIQPGADYFGIRLQAGQARHLLRVAAMELTDTHLPWSEAAGIPFPEHLHDADVRDWTRHVDAWLQAYVRQRAATPSRIDLAITSIQSNPAQPPTIAALADLTCLSRRQFERRFRQQVGVSPHRFVAIMRFQKASELLRRGDSQVAQIAQACGYADHSHLVRAFDDMAAMPPSRWRRDVANVQDRAG